MTWKNEVFIAVFIFAHAGPTALASDAGAIPVTFSKFIDSTAVIPGGTETFDEFNAISRGRLRSLFLWVVVNYKPFISVWWLGLVCGILSALSLASGALTLFAGLGVVLVRWLVADDRSPSGILVMIILLLLVVASIELTPVIAGHAPLQAQPVSDFLRALEKSMSWPVGRIGLLVIQAPLFIFMYKLLRNDKEVPAPLWFIFASGLWLLGQFAALSYGRSGSVNSSRYLDILAIGLVLNFACFYILMKNFIPHSGAFNRYGMMIFIVLVAGGGAAKSVKITQAVQEKAQQGKQQEINVRAYLINRDFTHLSNKPRHHIPYPNPKRLKHLLDNPTIRAMLPENILAPNPQRTPSAVKSTATFLLSKHKYFMILGGAAFGMLILTRTVGRKNRNELQEPHYEKH